MSDVSAIAAGQTHALALKKNGTLWAAGQNGDGQLGIGDQKPRDRFVKVLDGVSAIAAGGFHSLALKEDGTLWGAGNNAYRQLGLQPGQTLPAFAPVAIQIKSFTAGEFHTLAIRSEGTLWAAGNNSFGQLGNGGRQVVEPGLVLNLPGLRALAAGDRFSFFIGEQSEVAGRNVQGQLGLGHRNDQHQRIALPWKMIAAAGRASHSLVIRDDGSAWASGRNDSGQLGTGDTKDVQSWVQVMKK
jgi:alpha-tubulin suppressor-like RCC1 family protein